MHKTKRAWRVRKIEAYYIMRIDFMLFNQICTRIFVNFADERIQIANHTDDLISRAFGVVEKPDWDDFEDFLESRVFERTRADAKDWLRALDVPGYDPLAICEKTAGRVAEDPQYLRFAYRKSPTSVFWRWRT